MYYSAKMHQSNTNTLQTCFFHSWVLMHSAVLFSVIPALRHEFTGTNLACYESPPCSTFSLRRVLIWRSNYMLTWSCSLHGRPLLPGNTRRPHTCSPCPSVWAGHSIPHPFGNSAHPSTTSCFCWIVRFHGGIFNQSLLSLTQDSVTQCGEHEGDVCVLCPSLRLGSLEAEGNSGLPILTQESWAESTLSKHGQG